MSTPADRQRLYRQRTSAGSVCVRIELGRDDVDGLIDCGLLGEWHETDREAIAAAVLKAVRALRSYPVMRHGAEGADHGTTNAQIRRHVINAAHHYRGLAVPLIPERVTKEMTAYFNGAWQRRRTFDRCPQRHHGTAREAFWHLLRIHNHPMSVDGVSAALGADFFQEN